MTKGIASSQATLRGEGSKTLWTTGAAPLYLQCENGEMQNKQNGAIVIHVH